MKKRTKIIFIVGIISCLIIGALIFIFTGKKEQNPVYDIPQTEVKQTKKKIDLTILRYEKDIFNIDQNHIVSEMTLLAKKYPDFFIQPEFLKDSNSVNRFKAYLNDPVIQEIYKSVMTEFPDLTSFKDRLIAALARYYTLYPYDTLSGIITAVPGIDFETPSLFLYENYLIINLDLYLGSSDKHYPEIGIPKYIYKRMDKKYLITDCFNKAIVYKHLPKKAPITLLDHIIYEGKKLYFTEAMNPDIPKMDIIGYDEKEMQWAEANYGKVWAYMIENNHLFSKEEEILRRYVKEAPFTKPFDNASPGRMGNYIGWLIVKNYMTNCKKVTMDELMQNTDSQAILRESLFKPKK